MWLTPLAALLFAYPLYDYFIEIVIYLEQFWRPEDSAYRILNGAVRLVVYYTFLHALCGTIWQFCMGPPTLEQERISYPGGFLRLWPSSIALVNIQFVRVRDPFPHERLLDFGTVIVKTQRGKEVKFTYIKNPREFCRRIKARLASE